jgi:hypothetical protein
MAYPLLFRIFYSFPWFQLEFPMVELRDDDVDS